MGAGWGAIREDVRKSFSLPPHVRVFLLAALACLSLVCTIVASRHGAFVLCADIAIGCCLAYPLNLFLLRRALLAALVTCAPLPGILGFLAVAPSRGAATIAEYCFGLGLVVSVLIADAVAASVINGGQDEHSTTKVARCNGRFSAAIAAVLALPALACAGLVSGQPWLDVAAGGLLAMVSTAAVLGLGTSFLNYGEDYIARANRSREMFARLFAPVLVTARPRFGFSVFGIACVIVAVAVFQTPPLRAASATCFWAVVPLAVFATTASYFVLRDWRRSLTIVLSMVPALQIGLWVLSRSRMPVVSTTWAVLSIAASIIFALQLTVARVASGGLATEDDVVAGSERAIETTSIAVCIAGLAGIASTLPFGRSAWPTWGLWCVTIIVGAMSAVLFQPAIAITLESLVPRAATVAERYRIK